MQSLVKKGPVAPAFGSVDAGEQAPTRGATSSLGQLIKMLENPRECRHIAICKAFGLLAFTLLADDASAGRYFGEKPKADVKESYCRSKLARKLMNLPDEIAQSFAMSARRPIKRLLELQSSYQLSQ